MAQDTSYTRFFNPDKSFCKTKPPKPIDYSNRVWDSIRRGTYVKSIHGELKREKDKK